MENACRFSIVQRFPLPILYHLLTYHMRNVFSDRAKGISAYPWTPCWGSQMDMIDVRSLLVMECGAFGVVVKASKIWHGIVVCGVFLSQLFRAGEIVGYYHETLDCLNLTMQKKVRKTFEDGIMFVTVDDFSTWPLMVPMTFLDRTGK